MTHKIPDRRAEKPSVVVQEPQTVRGSVTVTINSGTLVELENWDAYAVRLLVMSKLKKAGVPVQGNFWPDVSRGVITRTDRPDGKIDFTWNAST